LIRGYEDQGVRLYDQLLACLSGGLFFQNFPDSMNFGDVFAVIRHVLKQQ